MAIYHLSMKNISRTRRNTVASLAYRAGVKLMDPETGEVFDYTSKPVSAVEFYIPEKAPQWAKDLQELILQNKEDGTQAISDMVESAEKRIDARIYKEVEFALPKELTEEQCKILGRRFIQKNLADKDILSLGNYHDLETEKPHCHIMMITRKATETGLDYLKNPELNKRSFLKNLRISWEMDCNQYLRELGIDARIDHRSHQERGLVLEPQLKLGKNVQEMERRLGGNPKDLTAKALTEKGQEHQELKLRNFYKIIKHPEIILDDVSKKQTTFMWGDVAKYLARHVDDQALFERILLKLENSKELICVQKEKQHSQSVFTTKARLLEERQFVENITALKNRAVHDVTGRSIEVAISRANRDLKTKLKDATASLSIDQTNAIQYMASPAQLSLVEGYAGAGKTTVMRVMKEIWEENNYKVYGLAPTGRAADNLDECGIDSVTIHSFLKTYRAGRNQLSPNSVLVLDEAGMVDSKSFAELIEAVDHLGVKLVASGDRGQLSPVEAGVPFRLAIEAAGKTDLTTVLRQKETWQQEATVLFGEGKAVDALKAYYEKGCIITVSEELPDDVVERYNLARRISGNINHSIHEDIKRATKEGEFMTLRGHPDYHEFKKWRGIRDTATETIFKDLDSYKPRLQELGVDGVDFAKKLINHPADLVDSTDNYQLARSLGLDWRMEPTHTCDPRLKTKQQMAQDWFQSTQDHKDDTQAMMAHSNKDVVSLNTLAREFKKSCAEIGVEDFTFTIERNAGDELGEKQTEFVERSFSKGDQIIFTKNDKGLGVKNGSLGRITDINAHKITAMVHSGEAEKEVSFAPNLYKNFDNGWAVTLHKNQGVTVDRSFVLGSYEQYKNLSYVGMTRHSKEAKLYTSTLDFWTQDKVYERLGRTQDKLSSLDYLDRNQATTLIKANDYTLGDTLKGVGQNLAAIGYVGHKKWESICEKFQEYTPRKPLIQVPTSLLGDLKSEADRADELFAKKKEMAAKAENAVAKEASLQAPEKPKLNPFKIERATGNPFKVERASGNPFDVRGMGK